MLSVKLEDRLATLCYVLINSSHFIQKTSDVSLKKKI